MGTIESKSDGVENVKELHENSHSPTCAQDIWQSELDPRSPTAGIARTPIGVQQTSGLLNPTPASNTNVTGLKHLIDDPRSPATDFIRTPIVVTDSTKKLPLSLHNKLLDNARIPQLVPTPAKPTVRSAKLLDARKLIQPSTPLDFPENKRNSLVGLLETNVDFIETDLDEVIQNKSKCEDEHKSDSLIVRAEDTTELGTTPPPLLLGQFNDNDDLVMNKNTKSKPPPTDSSFTLTEDDLSGIDVLNQKLTNLIYEDKLQLKESPVKTTTVQCRTPLQQKNPNSQLSKNIPTLRVSDKPTKLPKSGSKIPVFKDKKGKLKNVQCENTPPRTKVKPSQWAAEDSMII